MGLLHARLAKYDLPQKMMEKGIYPYFRQITSKQGTEVTMDGQQILMFGSNAYTGLTGDDRVINAGIEALKKYGSGCAGSRFLNGTLDLHVQLEKELAEVKSQLEEKNLKIEHAGSLAEASLALTNIFEEAQKAADLYLENVRQQSETRHHAPQDGAKG